MQMSTFSPAAIGTTPTAKAAPAGQKAEMEKAAKAFEAIFLRQMIATMRSSSLGEGLTDSGASEQFRDMSDARTADSMAQTGRFGIAQLLMKQLGGALPADPKIAADPATPTKAQDNSTGTTP